MRSCTLDFYVRPLFFPVIHALDVSGALDNIAIAVDAGADGIFLINQTLLPIGLAHVHNQVERRWPDLWVGVNLLGHQADEVLLWAKEREFQGVWFDHTPSKMPSFADRDFLVFGGAAFKGQPDVPPEQWASEALIVADRAEVVVTSGRATGEATPLDKVRAMRKAIGKRANSLAIASGVSLENVDDYLPLVDAFLVASSIESAFGVFDSAKVQALARRIQAYRHPADLALHPDR